MVMSTLLGWLGGRDSNPADLAATRSWGPRTALRGVSAGPYGVGASLITCLMGGGQVLSSQGERAGPVGDEHAELG